MHTILLASLITTLNLLLFLQPTLSLSFTISNNCPFTIWPGTLAGSGTPQLSTTGFQLDSGKAVKIQSTPGWSGRIWARTGCRFDGSGTGSCQTGDCGGRLECDGNGASPPASLFEITLGKGTDKDFYDVSLVDGYNVPILAWPVGVPGGSSCNATGCVYDVNKGCPKELQVVGGDGLERLGGGGGGGGRQVVACKSACEAFGQDQYCCSGAYANPTTCRPSFYSSVFKKACPRAYSYAFDDSSSTFTCKAYDYVIVFCPAPIRATESDGRAPNPSSPPPPSVPLSPPSVPLSPPSLPLSPPSLPLSPPSLPLSPPPPENNYEAPMGGVFSSSHILQPISQVIFLLGILSLLIF